MQSKETGLRCSYHISLLVYLWQCILISSQRDTLMLILSSRNVEILVMQVSIVHRWEPLTSPTDRCILICRGQRGSPPTASTGQGKNNRIQQETRNHSNVDTCKRPSMLSRFRQKSQVICLNCEPYAYTSPIHHTAICQVTFSRCLTKRTETPHPSHRNRTRGFFLEEKSLGCQLIYNLQQGWETRRGRQISILIISQSVHNIHSNSPVYIAQPAW